MSDFLARELLYDYLADRLDPERKTCVEDCLAASRELERDLARITAASRYAKILADTHINPEVLTAIDEPETYLSVALKKTNYQKWPLAVRWGTEAAVVLTALILVLVVIPWQKVLQMGLSPRGREIILAEVHRPEGADRAQTVAGDDGPMQPETATAEAPPKEDAAVKVATNVAPQPVTIPMTGNILPAAAPENSEAKPGSKPAQPAGTKVAENAAPAPKEQASPAPPAEITSSRPKKPGEGALYRTVLSVADLSNASPAIRDKIVELGGKKAGEVELGWKKTPTSSYFHFTLPEDKYEEFTDFIAEYGDVDIVKEKHPRIMPAGTMRLIITVEEAKE